MIIIFYINYNVNIPYNICVYVFKRKEALQKMIWNFSEFTKV